MSRYALFALPLLALSLPALAQQPMHQPMAPAPQNSADLPKGMSIDDVPPPPPGNEMAGTPPMMGGAADISGHRPMGMPGGMPMGADVSGNRPPMPLGNGGPGMGDMPGHAPLGTPMNGQNGGVLPRMPGQPPLPGAAGAGK